MSPENLTQLLVQTPNIKTLVYDTLLPVGSTPIDPRALRTTLDYVRTTLTHLTVGLEFSTPEEVDADVICLGSIGSLRDFSSLITLRASLAVILGEAVEPRRFPLVTNLLPSRLQQLTLTDDLWDMDEAFIDWAGFPTLQAILTLLEGRHEAFPWTSMVGENPLPGTCALTAPHLHGFAFDMRNREWAIFDEQFMVNGRGWQYLRRICEAQGISCEILG
ncbi:hypothetical protein K458DRAFT_392787 [Lentithecium fluviatile CBS 122367]|uniref:Uncharacterized protein n=1 Tax=Lentithecium fluviatile CBS 122367 TaxID=1168545 RepID=A0A6G1IRF1_9PLEO|nr:hypothetical protein K458DRAFT_392787 [Lentithecium fluviatile CBS 122367]